MLPKNPQHTTIALLALVLLAGSLAGCANMNKTGKGAVIGASAGAVLGGVIGKTQDETAKGAIIGAAVGGAAGAIIGAQMDKQAKELDEELEDADVERVGEGIQITFDSAILFDFDSATLRPQAQADLRDLAYSLRDYPNTDVVIVGHTDVAARSLRSLPTQTTVVAGSHLMIVPRELSKVMAPAQDGHADVIATSRQSRKQIPSASMAQTANTRWRPSGDNTLT